MTQHCKSTVITKLKSFKKRKETSGSFFFLTWAPGRGCKSDSCYLKTGFASGWVSSQDTIKSKIGRRICHLLQIRKTPGSFPKQPLPEQRLGEVLSGGHGDIQEGVRAVGRVQVEVTRVRNSRATSSPLRFQEMWCWRASG